MNLAVLEKICAAYGLSVQTYYPAQKGYRNLCWRLKLQNGKNLNLIIYKSEIDTLDRIRRANIVSNYLTIAGMPARRTYTDKLVCLKTGSLIKYGTLYEYLSGNTIPWESYNMERIKELGRAMSDMHHYLNALDRQGLATVADESSGLLGRMVVYFDNPSVTEALETKLKLLPPKLLEYSNLIQTTSDLDDQRPLHMDFVRGNILFQDNKITGILDFEKTSWGHPVYDIARTLAFLLVDCKFKTEDKVRKYFLQSGYNKRGKERFNDPGCLEGLINFFLLHDFYKFLLHNPYESLPDNEHFVRTKDLLIKRNILRQN